MAKIPTTTPEESYLQAALNIANARNAYDHKKANNAFDELVRAAKQIRLTHPDGGEKFFTSMLAHDIPHVVSKAAFNLIPLNPKLARETYEILARGPPGEVRFNAEMTLKHMETGRLDPNWFMRDE